MTLFGIALLPFESFEQAEIPEYRPPPNQLPDRYRHGQLQIRINNGADMIPHMQHLFDWRVVLLALFAFYFLPSLLVSALLDSLNDESRIDARMGGRPLHFFRSSILSSAAYFQIKYRRI